MTLRELLYGMMLRSGNDAATALALAISPTVPEFANLMNETAKRAGAQNSNFKNPHGLDAEGHYTTARDLALITAYAMKNPTFAEIVATKEIKISGKDYPRIVRNKNRLLQSCPDCVGVKTGFTKKAGRCYVGAFNDNGMTVICVVLNCGPMFEEAATLMEMADEEFTMTRIAGICDGGAYEFFFPLRADEKPEIKHDNHNVILGINGEVLYTVPCESINISLRAELPPEELPNNPSPAAE